MLIIVREDQRQESLFEARNTAIDIRLKIHELCMRRFGYKGPKPSKIPKNFEIWSAESRERYLKRAEEIMNLTDAQIQSEITDAIKRLKELTTVFIYSISDADIIKPKQMQEYIAQHDALNNAIKVCGRIKVELNYIAEIVNCNINWLADLSKILDNEIQYIQHWQSRNLKIRDKILKEQSELKSKY